MAKSKQGVMRLDLQGADELQDALRDFSHYFRGTAVKNAVRKAARVMVPPIRRATPKSKKKYGKQAAKNPPGTLRKSTGVVFRRYKGGAIQAAYVGHRWPKGAAAHLVEFGTTDRFRKNRRRGYTGFVKGRPFMQPIVMAKKSEVRSTMRHELAAEIEKAREKAAMKSLKKATR